MLRENSPSNKNPKALKISVGLGFRVLGCKV